MDMWRDTRWQQTGVNAAGDKVFRRVADTVEEVEWGPPPDLLSSMTKAELVALAEQRGLSKTGSKADLIARLGG